MLEDDFRLLGLTPRATLHEVKKAYRVLAKKAHPDRFEGEKEKNRQAAVMADFNDAYRRIVKWFREGPRAQASTAKRETPENDTSLYKKGVEIYDSLNIKIALKIGVKEYDAAAVISKNELARHAMEYFTRLLERFPDSDWAFDSEERLKDIPKYIKLLEENAAFLETHKIGATKKGTPFWKKK